MLEYCSYHSCSRCLEGVLSASNQQRIDSITNLASMGGSWMTLTYLATSNWWSAASIVDVVRLCEAQRYHATVWPRTYSSIVPVNHPTRPLSQTSNTVLIQHPPFNFSLENYENFLLRPESTSSISNRNPNSPKILLQCQLPQTTSNHQEQAPTQKRSIFGDRFPQPRCQARVSNIFNNRPISSYLTAKARPSGTSTI